MGLPYKGSPADIAYTRGRVEGSTASGQVSLRDFDLGVVETLRAELIDDNYYLKVNGLSSPPGLPGVPITFAYPEDVFEKLQIPVLVITRDDVSPALSRWHPGALEYQAPSAGALQSQVTGPSEEVRTGWSSIELKPQATPVDIVYTIKILARHRGGVGQRNQINRLLDYVLRIYQPYCFVAVRDSFGDIRTYEAFMEGTSNLDEASEVGKRMLGFGLTLRVEAEYDLSDPVDVKTVTQWLGAPTLTVK